MFAYDIMISCESREQEKENLMRWRYVLEGRGMKSVIGKLNTCVNVRQPSGTLGLQGAETKKGHYFKYLGSTVQSNREFGKEVKK